MPETCGVCEDADSKYKCPVCELRYCSIACYKTHKTIHDQAQPKDASSEEPYQHKPVDRPGTKQRIPKVDFTGFENDKEFQRLLYRYPSLKHQLQLVYGLTLEPGPDEAGSWSRRDWFPAEQDLNASTKRGGFQGRGRGSVRGRGRGGGGRGGPSAMQVPLEDRIRGPWTQSKGEKQGKDVIQRMRNKAGSGSDELADGMTEFLTLCQMKFGDGG